MYSAWLRAAVTDERGLCIPGTPAGGAADVHLRADAVILRLRGASARFAWDEYDGPGQAAARRRGESAWWVSHVSGGRHGRRGVAIEEFYPGDRGADALRSSIRSWPWRFLRTVDAREIVPLQWAHVTSEADAAERATFAVLLAILSDRPEWRARLADPRRGERLAHDMWRPLTAVDDPTGFRRDTGEALRAMRALGYRHRLLGRPVPGDRLATVDVITRRVIAHVGRNPYARDVRLDPEKVAGLVRRHYLDIEPWPFTALAEPAAPADPGPTGHRPTWWRATPPWAPGGGEG